MSWLCLLFKETHLWVRGCCLLSGWTNKCPRGGGQDIIPSRDTYPAWLRIDFAIVCRREARKASCQVLLHYWPLDWGYFTDKSWIRQCFVAAWFLHLQIIQKMCHFEAHCKVFHLMICRLQGQRMSKADVTAPHDYFWFVYRRGLSAVWKSLTQGSTF